MLSKKEFQEIYSKVPRLCLDLILRNKQGILLTKRLISPYSGKWHLPGGSVFFRESLNQAVERIAKKELSINVSVIDFLGYMEFLSLKSRHDISLVILCEAHSSSILLNEEASDFIFTKDIPENTIEEHKLFLRDNWQKIFP